MKRFKRSFLHRRVLKRAREIIIQYAIRIKDNIILVRRTRIISRTKTFCLKNRTKIIYFPVFSPGKRVFLQVFRRNVAYFLSYTYP